jgi:hypothetical protein
MNCTHQLAVVLGRDMCRKLPAVQQDTSRSSGKLVCMLSQLIHQTAANLSRDVC